MGGSTPVPDKGGSRPRTGETRSSSSASKTPASRAPSAAAASAAVEAASAAAAAAAVRSRSRGAAPGVRAQIGAVLVGTGAAPPATPPQPHPPADLRAYQPAYHPWRPQEPEQAREGGGRAYAAACRTVSRRRLSPAPSEPERGIKPRETCGQEGCIVKQAMGQERIARAHVDPRRSTETAPGRLTVGGR